MTHRLTTNYAKNYCNRTLIVKVIIENVVTCFLGHSVGPGLTIRVDSLSRHCGRKLYLKNQLIRRGTLGEELFGATAVLSKFDKFRDARNSGVGRILVWRGPRTAVPKAPRGEAPKAPPRGVGRGEKIF